MAVNKEIKVNEKTALYSGAATITLKHGKRTYKVIKKHNRGTTDFFKYILRVLVGGSLPTKRPSYLYLYTKNGNSEEPILSFPILYEGTSEVSVQENSASVTYSFLIPDTFLPERTTISGFRINALDSDGFDDKVYAVVDFSDEPVAIESSTNLYITWRVTLSGDSTESVDVV